MLRERRSSTVLRDKVAPLVRVSKEIVRKEHCSEIGTRERFCL